MAWFTRRQLAPDDLIAPDALARFGRFQFLGAGEISGVTDPSEALRLVDPLRHQLYRDASAKSAALAELERHARGDEWAAVGAWKFAREFLDFSDPTSGPLAQRAVDGGLRAVASMQVVNLGIHLSPADGERFQHITGAPAPNDGFWGPPVFDSSFGPTRQYYDDHATAAAAARSPVRLSHRPGVAPASMESVNHALWDFGMLMVRGPLVVPEDCRFEPNLVRPLVAAAADADHSLFVSGVEELFADEARTRGESLWVGCTSAPRGFSRTISSLSSPAPTLTSSSSMPDWLNYATTACLSRLVLSLRWSGLACEAPHAGVRPRLKISVSADPGFPAFAQPLGWLCITPCAYFRSLACERT